MRDPHIHAEKTYVPGLGHREMRSLVIEATGMAPDLPKTVGTGCGRRRPLDMTSTTPEMITCLACRDWARDDYLLWAGMAEAAAEIAEVEQQVSAEVTPDELRDEGRSYRELAARFGGAP